MFIKQNKEPVIIECVVDEHQEEKDFVPSFWWWNHRYYLEDFVRVHNNPFMGGEFPDYIHAVQAEEYFHPLYIELIDDEHINIYEEEN